VNSMDLYDRRKPVVACLNFSIQGPQPTVTKGDGGEKRRALKGGGRKGGKHVDGARSPIPLFPLTCNTAGLETSKEREKGVLMRKKEGKGDGGKVSPDFRSLCLFIRSSGAGKERETLGKKEGGTPDPRTPSSEAYLLSLLVFSARDLGRKGYERKKKEFLEREKKKEKKGTRRRSDAFRSVIGPWCCFCVFAAPGLAAEEKKKGKKSPAKGEKRGRGRKRGG